MQLSSPRHLVARGCKIVNVVARSAHSGADGRKARWRRTEQQDGHRLNERQRLRAGTSSTEQQQQRRQQQYGGQHRQHCCGQHTSRAQAARCGDLMPERRLDFFHRVADTSGPSTCANWSWTVALAPWDVTLDVLEPRLRSHLRATMLQPTTWCSAGSEGPLMRTACSGPQDARRNLTQLDVRRSILDRQLVVHDSGKGARSPLGDMGGRMRPEAARRVTHHSPLRAPARGGRSPAGAHRRAPAADRARSNQRVGRVSAAMPSRSARRRRCHCCPGPDVVPPRPRQLLLGARRSRGDPGPAAPSANHSRTVPSGTTSHGRSASSASWVTSAAEGR